MCSLSACETVRVVFFFQAEDGIRDLVRSRGLGDVYKRQEKNRVTVYAAALVFCVGNVAIAARACPIRYA